MGQFGVTLTFFPCTGGEPLRLEALVDTGSAYTVVPRPIYETLGCAPSRSQRVRLADGRGDEWPLALVEVECEGRRTMTPILGGPPDASVLLGVVTLEELGLGIDPLGRRLVPVEFYQAAVR
jgi:clan AA aspartic protease